MENINQTKLRWINNVIDKLKVNKEIENKALIIYMDSNAKELDITVKTMDNNKFLVIYFNSLEPYFDACLNNQMSWERTTSYASNFCKGKILEWCNRLAI